MSVLVAASACATGEPAGQDGSSGDGVVSPPAPGAGEGPAYAWLDIELTDAVTGDSYTVADFAGDPVLLHAFAVW